MLKPDQLFLAKRTHDGDFVVFPLRLYLGGSSLQPGCGKPGFKSPLSSSAGFCVRQPVSGVYQIGSCRQVRWRGALFVDPTRPEAPSSLGGFAYAHFAYVLRCLGNLGSSREGVLRI